MSTWTKDRDFVDIMRRSMPEVYKQYKDPVNRAKGAPPITAERKGEAWDLLMGEIDELKAETPDSPNSMHELGDVVLCGMFSIAAGREVY